MQWLKQLSIQKYMCIVKIIINLHVNMQIKFASGKCIHVNYNMSLGKLKFLISEWVINSQLMNYIINIYSHKSQVESEQLKLLLQVHVHNVHVWHMQAFSYTPFHQNRTEQNFYWSEIHIQRIVTKKQHIKYKTKRLLTYNQTTFVHTGIYCTCLKHMTP